jgi:uncharacterized membrane protein HdeD (DUF308 family)
MLLHHIVSHWWIMALRGTLALLFGVFLLAFPAVGLNFAILWLSGFMIADGITLILISVLDEDRWWAALLNGIVSLLAGGGISFGYKIESLPLMHFVAAWAAASGILEIAAAIRLHKMVLCECLMILAGVLSLAFGTVLLATSVNLSGEPLITVLVGMLWTALYTCLLGLVLLFLAFRFRSARAIRSVPTT